jgi:hypothetical protein
MEVGLAGFAAVRIMFVGIGGHVLSLEDCFFSVVGLLFFSFFFSPLF